MTDARFQAMGEVAEYFSDRLAEVKAERDAAESQVSVFQAEHRGLLKAFQALQHLVAWILLQQPERAVFISARTLVEAGTLTEFTLREMDGPEGGKRVWLDYRGQGTGEPGQPDGAHGGSGPAGGDERAGGEPEDPLPG